MAPKFTRVILFAALLLQQTGAFAQQDPMFTKYFFNTLNYNPAYAGSREFLSIIAVAREQWLGWNGNSTDPNGEGGAPGSQTLTVHSPIQERVGVGLSLFNDKIGATSSTGFNACYAYRIPFGKAKLSLGVNAGMTNWRADWSKLTIRDRDPIFEGGNPSLWVPTIGAGAYFYAENYYVGFSVPRLLKYNLRKPDPTASNLTENAQTYRHYYFTAGAAIPVNGDDLVFKPSFLIKSVGLFSGFGSSNAGEKPAGSPTEYEVDLSLLFFEKLWAGVAYRSSFEQFTDLSSHDSFDAWAAFYLRNGLRIGLAYDFPLTEIRTASYGSFELMLGYEFEYKVQKILTPRYF